MGNAFKLGQVVYVVERGYAEVPTDVGMYQYITSVEHVAIVQPWKDANLREPLYGILIDTAMSDEKLCAFPLKDCYPSLGKAEAALKNEIEKERI